MDPVYSRGFVVQNTVTLLDMKESKNSPILCIAEEKMYVTALKKNRYTINENRIESSFIIYWEYFDEDRQKFV